MKTNYTIILSKLEPKQKDQLQFISTEKKEVTVTIQPESSSDQSTVQIKLPVRYYFSA